MKTNKGIIGLGLIVAIVLGIAVVGGGAYYLGKGSNNVEVESPENILPNNENKELPIVENKQVNNNSNTTSSIKVITPNGGEKFNSDQKVEVKWASVGEDTVDIYLKYSDGNLCLVKTLPSSSNSWNFTPYNYKCLGNEKLISAGDYKVSLYLYKNNEMRPEPGTAFGSNDSSYIMDSSDNNFTINSAKVSLGSDMKLLSFKASKGEFLAETPRLVNSSDVEIKVYYFPTGTGITKPSLLGSMYPFVGASGSVQTWSLPAYLEPNTNNKQAIMTTSIYATLYIGGKAINTINYSVTGASAIYESIYGNDSSVSTTDNNLIKLTSCGVYLSKASNWSVISNTSNEVVLDILSTDHIVGTSGINIKCVLGNSITDTDAKFGNITYYYDSSSQKWMVSKPNERDGGTLPAVVATPEFTVNGFSVFKGTGRWLTYIVAISPSSILSLREGDTEGGYTQTLTNLVKTIKKF